jgi:hypothetical protein
MVRRTIGMAFPVFLAAVLFAAPLVHGANITWIGGDGTWNDGAGNNSNWSPTDEPDADDVAVFLADDTIDMGSNNEIAGLTMSTSATLNVLDHNLTINGPTTITGAGTRLFLDGGSITIQQAGAPVATIATATSGTFTGNGEVLSSESIAISTTVFDNNGTLSASNPVTLIITPPTAATLHFAATDADARIDLDGSLESGQVTVSRNQTLDVDVTLADIFNGDISMFQNTKLDIAGSWILGAGATIDVDNGATGGIGGAPAGVATIAGSSFSQNSGTITVVDADGTLQFDAPFTMNGGTLANNGLVVFNSSTNIGAAANFTMPTTSSSITVAANRVVNINQANFDLDGSNAATNVITVNDDAELTISTGDYDTDSVTNVFDGTVNLTNATIDITTSDAEFVMDGVLNSQASGSNQSLWTGEALDIGNDAGALDADVNISGSQPTQFGAQVDFNSDADLNVADGATVHFLATVNFNSVNGGNNAEFTGSGELIFSAGVNFSETTHLNMVGGTVDLDGADSIGDTINVDAPLTINAELMRSFGKNNGGGGVNLLDVNNSVNSGVLTVNLDAADSQWTLNAQGVMNLVNDNTDATLLAGSEVNLNGTVNVTGDVRITAPVNIGGTVNINTAAQPLRLAGGDAVANTNTIAGGTISGAGLLGADAGKALHGFGTINTGIDFDSTADLRADNGMLTINGSIVDVDQIGTQGDDGILNVTNAWNSSVADSVGMLGGELRGGALTIGNALGVRGHGLVSARVINNSQILALFDTLVVETAGDDNDWDGAGDMGVLGAASNGTLELRDEGAAFPFGGTVNATGGTRVFSNGFALDFNPGSTLSLTDSTYESTSSTDLGGTVTIGAGTASTIKVENNYFLSFETGSTTTLNGDLRLENNNIIIEQGASFSGTGAVVIPDGSHVVGENLADIGVLLDMQGAFRPGNSEGIGRVDVFDYQMSPTSELFIELKGTALNAFDRLVVDGVAIVDGYLSLDIDDVAPMTPFVPVLGNTFNILTASAVTGTFDTVDVSGMPAGLAFRVNYLANAVQLQVVNKPIFSADFDDDGEVDSTYLVIWRNAYDHNPLGDADGDNDSDGNDFLIWQRQVGSKPAVAASGVTQAAVPEPTTGVLAAVCAMAAGRAIFLWRRRRRLY